MRLDPGANPDQPRVSRTAAKSIIPVAVEVVAGTVLLGWAMLSVPSVYAPELNRRWEDMLRFLAEYYGTQAFGLNFGTVFGLVVGGIVGLLLLSAVNTAVAALIGLLYMTARDGEMPRGFTRLNAQGVPWVPLLIAVALPMIVVALASDLETLDGLYAIGVVGAITDNGTGIASLGWQTRVLSIAVLEKASSIGAHGISGCVLDPRALAERARAGGDGEVVRPVVALHDADIDLEPPGFQQRARGARCRARQPEVAGQQIPGPAGEQTERDAGADDARGHLHGGPIPAMAHEHVESRAARVLGLAIGYLTLRLRGVYFVVFTFGLTELIHQVLNWWEIKINKTVSRYIFTDVSNVEIYETLLAAALLTIVGSWYVSQIRLGYALRAIGEDETVARHTGINTTYVKVFCFALSAGVMAFVGAVLALRYPYVDASIAFNNTWSFQVLIAALLGGAGRAWGPAVGAIPLVLLSEFLAGTFPHHFSIALGLCFVVIVYFLPGGITRLLLRLYDSWRLPQVKREAL